MQVLLLTKRKYKALWPTPSTGKSLFCPLTWPQVVVLQPTEENVLKVCICEPVIPVIPDLLGAVLSPELVVFQKLFEKVPTLLLLP